MLAKAAKNNIVFKFVFHEDLFLTMWVRYPADGDYPVSIEY